MDKVCTWWVISTKTQETSFCNGAEKCCALLDLKPMYPNWDKTVYVAYGKRGASYNNTVFAQVIYLDENLEQGNTYFDSVASEWDSIKVNFKQENGEKRGSPENLGYFEQVSGEIGKPVKWKRLVSVDKPTEIGMMLKAKNIQVKKIENNKELHVQPDINIGNEGAKLVLEKGMYEIEFETDAPKKEEVVLKNNKKEWKKKVTIFSDSAFEGEFEYKNIYSYADIKESKKDNIRLIWKKNGIRYDVTHDPELNVKYYDTNNNGLIDRISWITPHLSTQEFEIIINIDGNGNNDHIEVSLSSPTGQELIIGDIIEFDFSVLYNSSLGALCNVTVDDSIIAPYINVSLGDQTNINNTFDSGLHHWHVTCFDNISDIASSATEYFITDSDEPVVELNTENGIVSSGSLYLNFTARDNYDLIMKCNLSINGEVHTSNINAINDTMFSLPVNGLEDGMYEWQVGCSDDSGNIGTSETRRFEIRREEENFSVDLLRDKYNLGEESFFIIYAPDNANLTIFIETPEELIIRDYENRNYPSEELIDFIQKPGVYNIDLVLFYDNYTRRINKSFTVENTLFAEIEANETTVKKGKPVYLSSKAGGGIGSLTSTWDFGDGKTAKGWSVAHEYKNLGTYLVKLTVNDSYNNQATDTMIVHVREERKLTVTVKDNKTDKPISGAEVFLDSDREITNESGKVVFHKWKDEYTLKVQANDYIGYIDKYDLSNDASIFIRLDKIDSDPPSISLISPKQGESVNSKEAEFRFKIKDDSSTSCSVYVRKENDKWKYIGSKSDIRGDEEQTIQSSELEEGKYEWNLSCTDSRHNTASLIETFVARNNVISGEEGSYSNAEYLENSMYDEGKYKEVVDKIDEYLESVREYNSNEKDVGEVLGIEENMRKTRRVLQQVIRDLANLKINKRNLSKDEMDELAANYTKRAENAINSTVVKMSVLGSDNFIKYTKNSDVEKIIMIILRSQNVSLDKKQRDRYVSDIKSIQENTTVTVKVDFVEIEYLDGRKEYRTLIRNTVTSSDIKNKKFVENIPKDIIENADEIIFMTPATVIKKDPIISFSLDESGEIAYYVKKKINPEEAKKIESVLVSEKGFPKESMKHVTGFFIFDMLSDIDNPGLVIQIAVIVFLIIIFILYQFEVFDKVMSIKVFRKLIKKISSVLPFKNKKLSEIEEMIKGSYASLDIGQIEEAEETYPKIMELFNSLDKNEQSKIYDETVLLYNEIIHDKIFKLIRDIDHSLDVDDKEKAAELYKELEKFYKELKPDYKQKVAEECHNIFMKVKQALTL
ncbi:PKD domain-containing protein [Candidatus Woesearchaeota archaeon]|nr:MAG: PKD domain-containing protein [Candidatus Woesearchaeota archaeon]